MFLKNIKVFQGEYLNLSGKGIHAKIRFLPSFKLYFLLPYKKEKIFHLSWSHHFSLINQIINTLQNERCFPKGVSLIIFSHFCLFFSLSLINFEGSLILFSCISHEIRLYFPESL
ncbi:hypothetical protein GGR06_002756 [Bacteroides reticulotermitis]|uniref:Uncharacterized protein n=1 Tax=Bacteroides reticulotermitis TaxID=1133319 RepID=A0A840D634_9BACE|nr:hypothetical protein [Bacteroides reticulotermitis]